MTEFVEVAQLEQIAPGKSKLVYIEEKSIALFNVDGEGIRSANDKNARKGKALTTK